MNVTLQLYWDNLGKQRCSIGLMLFKAELYHTVSEVAARSDAILVDFRDLARDIIPAGGRYVDFRPDTLLSILRNAHDANPSRKLIVQNFDLGVARLKKVNRELLWETLLNKFPPNSNTAVALAMPDEQTAGELLPAPETLREWIHSKRALRATATQANESPH